MKHPKQNIPKICQTSGKVAFSEAQASRRLGGKYDEIIRYYKCPDSECGGYHLTSESIEETLEHGLGDCTEENKLLRQQNKTAKEKISSLEKTNAINVKALQRRNDQQEFLINFICDAMNFDSEQRINLKNNVKEIGR